MTAKCIFILKDLAKRDKGVISTFRCLKMVTFDHTPSIISRVIRMCKYQFMKLDMTCIKCKIQMRGIVSWLVHESVSGRRGIPVFWATVIVKSKSRPEKRP